MGLFDVIVLLICVGIVLFLVNKAPFIDARWKTVIFWIAVIATILWLVSLFGIFDRVNQIRVGR